MSKIRDLKIVFKMESGVSNKMGLETRTGWRYGCVLGFDIKPLKFLLWQVYIICPSYNGTLYFFLWSYV